MIDIRSHTHISAPPGDVFAYIADFANNPEWQSGMKTATWTSEPPLRVGSTYDQVATFFGRVIESHFEVTAYEPGRSVTIETRSGSFPITVTRTVQQAANGCRVDAHVRGEPSGFLGMARPLMRWVVKRSVDHDYRRLKALLEEGSGA